MSYVFFTSNSSLNTSIWRKEFSFTSKLILSVNRNFIYQFDLYRGQYMKFFEYVYDFTVVVFPSDKEMSTG